jgi:hypothetical protein
MRTPITPILLIVSLCLFLLSGLLMRPVVALRPVRKESGEIMHRPDGRVLTERDTIGQFRVNWDAYTCMFGSFIFLGWALARGCRHWYVRHRTHDTPKA